MSSHYSGQRLRPFVIYIQVALRKTLFIGRYIGIGISIAIRVSFALFFCVLFFVGGGTVLVFGLFYTAFIIT